MMFMTIVVMFPTTPTPEPATMNYTVVVLGGTLALAIIYYYFPVYGGVHWFKGPISTIDSSASSTDSEHLSKSGNDGGTSLKKSSEKFEGEEGIIASD